MDFKSISLKTTASKKILAVILSVLILLTAIPVGLVTSAKAASADDCMAVELGGKKVYFYGADTLEADETKDTVIHYTVSDQSDPSIYVDGKSEVDTTGVDVDAKEKTIDFGEWLGNQDKWVAVQLDDTKTVPSSEPVDVEVDKVAPVITISGNATAWTKDDVTLTVSAVDSKDGKEGVGVAAYNWGDGWSAVTTLKVSENKTYTVSVKDRVGNVAQESVVVDKIDKTAPKITNVKVDPDEWSNKVSYEVIAEDSESGVKSYKMDDGAWQDSNKFDVTDNKEHNFFAVDNAGNESESVAATATKYDNKKPVVNSVDVTYGGTSVSNDSYTTSNKKYEFTVDAKDDESGVKEYSIDSITWQDSSVFSLNGGATYSFYVKDNAGNVSEPFEVALKKDDDAPVISKIAPSTDQPTNSTITVKVEATDDVAGIKSYKIDDGAWQTSNTFEINDCQPHKFYVCDNAVPSNVSEATEFTAKNYCDVTPVVKSVDLSNDKDQKWTNQKITATVNADSVKNTYGTEFAIVGYKMDNGEWQTSNEFKDAIDNKAEHKFYVKDSAGCVSEAYVVKSEKYDAKVPELAENVEFAQTNGNAFAKALNWLTFGKFFNEKLEITVKVKDLADTTNNASGVDVDKLKFVFENGTTSIEFSKDKFESVETENGVTTFVITVDKDELKNFKGSAHIYITDNAGNETGDIAVTTANSNLGYVTDTGFNFMIENDAPVISNLKTQDDKTLYKEKFNITFGVNDQVAAKEYSGIAQVKITANGATVYDKKFNDSAVTPNADISYTFNAPSEVEIDKKECKVVFEIYVCDNSGNVTTESRTVIYDSVPPEIKNVSCVPGTEQWTNKTTKVVVDASDNYQLADNAYKMDGASNDETGWKKENTFEINDGKNHTLYVRDKAGNISSQSVNAKYDITAPVISSVTLNPDLKQWTNKAVTATVVADDKVGDSTKEVAASAVKSYKMDNGEWQTSNEFKDAIDNKAEHKFYVKDSAGCVSEAYVVKSEKYDAKVPELAENVEFAQTNGNAFAKALNWLTFGKFFNEKLEITVKVKDLADTTNNASGVDVDKLKFVFENGTTSIEFSKDKFESVETENGVTTFVITANKDEIKNFKGTAYVSVTDNAGNKSDIAVTTENSNLATDENDKDFNFMIENDAPVIDGIDTTNNATIKNGYDFTFNVKDEQKDKNYSGIEQIQVTANDVPVYDKKYNDNAVTPNAGITLTVNGNNQTVNGVTINEWNNGDIVFKISARDNAGNKSEKTIKYDYDHTAPIISKFKISKNDAEQVTVDDYGFFFKSATTIKVYAEDNKKVVKKDEINEAFASGVASITVETLERDGTITVNTYEVANSDKIKQDNNGLYATVDIPAGFKGQIYALATDYTGNKPKDKDTGEDLYVHPDGTIVENGEQHGQNSAIEITNANKPVSQQSNTKKYSNSDKNVALDKEQSYDSTQNVPLYDKKAKFKVAVSDKVSGIKSVKYTLIEDGKESSDTLKIKTTKAADNNSKNNDIKKAEIEKGDELLTVSTGNEDQSNKAKEEWTVSSKITDNDINLATKIESDIVVDANYNDIVLKIELTDNAGNKSYDYVIFGIDRTAPEITVAYKSSAKPETENYYSKTRSAYITIKERNITSEDVQLLIEKCTNMERNFSASDKTEFRKGFNIEKNKIKNGSGNHDNRAYQIKVNFDKDGNYRIKTLKCVDTAKNANTAVKHVKYESSSNNDVVTAKNSTSFTIDKVKPVLKVSLDRNDQVHNKKYFNKTRTATITVTEHNFDTRDKADFVNNITASLNGKTINKPSVSSFKRQGGSDKWVATVKFDADGDYTLAFKVTDKAGNVFDVKKNTSGVFSGNAASDFTIDKTAPTISITNALANNRSYTTVPTIVLTEKDNNCSNITSSVEGTYYDDNTKSLKKLSLKANSNGVLTADHRTQNEVKYSVVEKDGIYTITVSCVDLAGNKSDTKILRFTKNAEGSVFIPSADLSKLNNDYSNKAKLSKELYIDEYSANEIKNADYYININGKRVSENIISRKLVKDSSSANGGWYHYRYTIDNNAIRSEGEYSVYIKSSVTIDKNNTIHNNDSKNSKSHRIDINFTIDNTNPYVKITGLDRHTFIKTDKVPVKFYITDSNLSYVKVWVYDSNTKFDENTAPTYYWKASHKKDEANIKDWTEEDGMVNVGFELPSSNNRMNVRFEIKDKADNICSDDRDFNKDQIFVTGVEEGQRAGSFEVVNGNVVLKDISINENLSFSAVASVIKDNIKLAVVIIVAIILVLAAIIILPIIIKRRKKLDAEDEKLLD